MVVISVPNWISNLAQISELCCGRGTIFNLKILSKI